MGSNIRRLSEEKTINCKHAYMYTCLYIYISTYMFETKTQIRDYSEVTDKILFTQLAGFGGEILKHQVLSIYSSFLILIISVFSRGPLDIGLKTT